MGIVPLPSIEKKQRKAYETRFPNPIILVSFSMMKAARGRTHAKNPTC